MKYLSLLLLLVACQPSKVDMLKSKLDSLDNQKNELTVSRKQLSDSMSAIEARFNGTTDYLFDSTYRTYGIKSDVIDMKLKRLEKEIQDTRERVQVEK